MRRTATSLILVVTAVVAMSCRSINPRGSARISTTNVATVTRAAADRLEYAEIGSARVANAYEAVIRLRPQFLRRRSTTGDGQPVIYLDGVRQGGADILRSVPATVVYEIRFLTATAASAEFGRMHPAGVVSVRSKR
jgi:hypothetical protein